MANYIFIDESGDPGKPFKKSSSGELIPTGASLYYILTGIVADSQKLMQLEHRMMDIKNQFGYKKEIKSNEISLKLYEALLNILNELDIKTYYRMVDKRTYKGKFAVDGNNDLNNIFDEYNISKLVQLTTKIEKIENVEVVIDRADRRLHNGDFELFNKYIKDRSNTKTIKRISIVAHVNSEYVNVMQMSDLISGALRDSFTGKNKELKKVVNRSNLCKIY